MSATPDARRLFGGFGLDGMALALPMGVLREVVPASTLQPLPATAPCVAGGVDLRGVLVPAIDLNVLLRPGTAPATHPLLVIAVCDGRMVGLLADAVTGVFEACAPGLHAVADGPAGTPLLAGSVQRADGLGLAGVLSLPALQAVPGVPWIADPEPARATQRAVDPDVAAGPPRRPLMLLRRGDLRLAIDALAVHAAVSCPTLHRTVYQGGVCVGGIDYAGRRIATVDLGRLCGLDLPEGGPAAAEHVVLRLPDGDVSLLVDAVIDVASVCADEVVAIPACGLPRAGLLAGAVAIADEGEPATDDARAAAPVGAGTRAGRYLVLDAVALRACPELVGLSHVGTAAGAARAEAPRDRAGADAPAHGGRAMITFDLAHELATPLTEVQEILPLPARARPVSAAGGLLDILVERGRSIPVFCLSRLMGLPPPPVTPTASVLVVATADGQVGFAVPRLRSIEPARWETAGERPGARQLALLGPPDAERTLHVLDLPALAARAGGGLPEAAGPP